MKQVIIVRINIILIFISFYNIYGQNNDSIFIIFNQEIKDNIAIDTLFGNHLRFHGETFRKSTFENYYKVNNPNKKSIDYNTPWKKFLFVFPLQDSINLNLIKNKLFQKEYCSKKFEDMKQRNSCLLQFENLREKIQNPLIFYRDIQNSNIYENNESIFLNNYGIKNRLCFFIEENTNLHTLENRIVNTNCKIFILESIIEEKFIFYEYQ